jgi:hypothetical protein
MHDKYITIIDICLIYYKSDVYTVLSNKMFALIAVSMNVRFLHRLRCCMHGSPFSIDFLGLGSHVNLNLKMEVEFCVQHYLPIPC